MKKLIVLLLVIGVSMSGRVHAQSTGDLIQQLVLDYQKLQEFKSILSEMYQGYTVIKQGYEQIRHIAADNFNLHKLFLDGLLAVSPLVRDYVRVADVLRLAGSIVTEYRRASAAWHGSGRLTVAELSYIDRLYSRVFDRIVAAVSDLTTVLTDGELRMSDADRLRAIDRIYDDVNRDYRMLRQFNAQVSVQVAQRERASNDLNMLKQLYGNPH